MAKSRRYKCRFCEEKFDHRVYDPEERVWISGYDFLKSHVERAHPEKLEGLCNYGDATLTRCEDVPVTVRDTELEG